MLFRSICRRFPNFTLNPVGTQEDLYSQNKGNHRYLNHHQQSGMMHSPPHVNHASQSVAYTPIVAPMRHYGSGPNLGQIPVQPPQQQDQHLLYGLGGNGGYYDSFLGSNGAYPTM